MNTKRSYIEKVDVLKKNLIPFLMEKCENATTPFLVTELMKEFKEKFGFSESYGFFNSRIVEYRDENHKIEGVEKNAVVRQKFALNACLDWQYINELQKEAHLKVDSRMRITEYRANDGSLILQGEHFTVPSKNRTRGATSEETSVEKENNSEEQTVAMLNSKRQDRKDAPQKSLYEINRERIFKGFVPEYSSDEIRRTTKRNLEDSSEIAKKKCRIRATGCSVRVTRSGKPYSVKKTSSLVTIGPEEVFSESSDESDSEEPVPDDPNVRMAKSGQRHTISTLEKKKITNRNETELHDNNIREISKSLEPQERSEEKEVEKSKNVGTASKVASIPQGNEHVKHETNFGINPPAPSFYSLPPAPNVEGTSSASTYEPLILSRMASLRSESFRTVGISGESAALVFAEIADSVTVKEEVDDDIIMVDRTPKPEPIFKVPTTPEIKLNDIISQRTHEKLLQAIPVIMKTLDMSISEDVQERVRKMIEKLDGEGGGNKRDKVTMREIRNSIEQCILIVSKSSTAPRNEESVSLRNFFLLFRHMLISIDLPIFNNLGRKLKKRIAELVDQEWKVPAKKIQSALGTILEIVAP